MLKELTHHDIDVSDSNRITSKGKYLSYTKNETNDPQLNFQHNEESTSS